MRRSLRTIAALSLGVTSSGLACNAVFDIGEPRLVEDPGTDADADSAVSDGETRDEAATDGSGDGSNPVDYHDMTNPQFWKALDVSRGGIATYWGGGFDGRHVYFAPATVAFFLTRYDTRAEFSDTSLAYQPVPGAVVATAGAAFDGRQLLFPSSYSGVMTRVDPGSPFGSDAGTDAGSPFDLETLHRGAKAFMGAVFDGAFIHLIPGVGQGGNPRTAIFARYDVNGPLRSADSWKFYDHGTNPDLGGFEGGVFDGRYVYFAPRGWNGGHPNFMRLDPKAPYDDPNSWKKYDASLVDSSATEFQGAAYDGKKYVYFVPCSTTASAPHGTVVRYDKDLPFDGKSAWRAFDLAKRDPSWQCFHGAGFDGRYLYFIPQRAVTPQDVQYLPPLVRLDTQKDFEDPSAWSSFDLKNVSLKASAFAGAVFDGRFLYLVPNVNGMMLRFDAKTPASMPPGYNGSFL
jgi:hypothetical protein